jgi:nuclear polyadenylated RNA-binding protein NAB2
MAVEVSVGTPLATALQNVVQPRLAEAGWTTGGLDDSALSEYIILMLANGKTQEQIASELSNDLLGLGPEDDGAVNFSRWLFQQVDILSKQLNGSDQAGVFSAGESGSSSNQNNQSEGANGNGLSSNYDAEMGDTAEAAAGAMYALIIIF